MSDQRNVLMAALLSAVIVLGIGLPAGYFGLQKMGFNMGGEGGPEGTDNGATTKAVTKVVIELKEQTISEIRTVGEQVKTEISEQNETQAKTIKELSAKITELQQSQTKLSESVMRMASAPAKTRSYVPGQREDTFNQTIYFTLGIVEAPEIDQQIKESVPHIIEYAAGRECVTNVLGFSDTLGGDKSNLELSQKRAVHVASILGSEGVKIGNVKGWGERWLKEHTVDGIKNEKNRRVVIETECTGEKLEKPAATVGS